MNSEQYHILKNHLQEIVNDVPLRWGRIQNDDTDARINMFEHHSFQSLNNAICDLKSTTKDYFRKRWFLWKCAQCDEYLFYSQHGVLKNPNPRDSQWDFEFFNNPNLRFDLKGTVVPREIRESDSSSIPSDPMQIINFNYRKQSTGVRFGSQNRLFVVHIPKRWNLENQLRVNFDEKEKAYSGYLNQLRSKPNYQFFKFGEAFSDVIYLVEYANGKVEYSFGSDKLN